MKSENIITIPKHIISNEELVIMPRRIFEKLSTEVRLLRLSKEAHILRRQKKLPLLSSLKKFR